MLFKSKAYVTLAFVVLALVLLRPPAASGGTFTNIQIVGVWSQPVLKGDLANVGGVLGASMFVDNTGTAIYSISPAGDTLTWGGGSAVVPPLNASTVNFAGVFFNTLPLNTAGQTLGTITYFNGSSTDPTIIFGATLTLSATMNGVPVQAITPLSIPVTIYTTENGISAMDDADILTFNPPANLAGGKTARVYEEMSAPFDLIGSFLGDPTIQVNDIQLGAGATGGFVGGPEVLTPEPGTTSLVGGALALLALSRRRPRRKKNPAIY